MVGGGRGASGLWNRGRGNILNGERLPFLSWDKKYVQDAEAIEGDGLCLRSCEAGSHRDGES